jgi:hypothetical protein
MLRGAYNRSVVHFRQVCAMPQAKVSAESLVSTIFSKFIDNILP